MHSESGKAKVMIAGVVGLALLAGAAGTWWFFFRDEGQAQAAPEVGPMLEIYEIVTNLNDGERRAYIQVEIHVEVEDSRTLSLLDERAGPVRNEIIAILRSKTAEEVRGEEGMRQLGREIARRLNNLIPGGGVKEIYFSKLIVQ